MDEQLEPITLNTFNKMLEKDIAISRDLANYLEIKYTVFDTCLTLTILCQDLESKNLEGAAFTKQRIEDYYTECEAKLNKSFHFHKPLPLSFDDLDHLKIQLTNLKAATDDTLDLARDAVASIQRYPELLFTLHTMREKGVPTDDIDAAIKNTETELNEALAPLTFPTESFKTFILNLNFYRIQVQKLERWIHQKASETALVIAPPPPAPAPMPTPAANMGPNVLSALLENQIKGNELLSKVLGAVGLMQTDLTNAQKANQNFQHDARVNLQTIINHTAFTAAELPNHDQIETAQTHSKSQAKNILTYKDAALLMKQICGPYAVDVRTLIRWVNDGKEPTTGKPITDAAFSSIFAWNIWCQDYYAEMQKRTSLHNTIQKLAQKHAAPPPKNEK